MKTEVTSVTTRPHPISNTFHLIMTICTGGLWAPVWWFMARGHKVTTRSPVATAPTAAEGWTGQRLDPEYMAEHVPGSAEYKARHEIDGGQIMRDRIAAGATKAEARQAVIDEVRAEINRRNGR